MSKRIHEGAIRDEIANKSGDSKKILRDFSTELFDCIRTGLLTDGHVRLHQFGSFKLKWTKERKGKNPQTGEPIIIPAHPRITFTPTKALKDKASSGVQEYIETLAVPESTYKEKIINTEITSQVESTGKQNEDLISPVNTEPYLIKNIHSDKRKEKTRPFPLSLVAALLLLIAGIYFIDIDLETEKPFHADQTIVLENKSSVTAPIKTAVNSELNIKDTKNYIQDTNLATIEPSPPATDISHKTIPKQNEAEVFFKQSLHKLTDGDSLWRLSRKNYINPFYWPHIYQANKYKIRNPNKLLMGKTITLPTLYGNPENLSDEDRHNIAEGYFLVYQYQKKHNKPFPYYALLGAAKFDPSVIEDHAYEIDDEDWNSLQIASN